MHDSAEKHPSCASHLLEQPGIGLRMQQTLLIGSLALSVASEAG